MRRAKWFWKLCVICSGLFVTSVALTPDAKAFDVSIYAGVPSVTLVLFGLLIFLSIAAISTSIVEGSRSHLWKGLSIAAVAYAGFFHLPLARGYVLATGFGADTLVHLGYIKDIISSGALTQFEYPATHLLFAEGTLLTGLRPKTIMWPISWMFFVVFMLSTVVFAQRMSGSRRLAAATGLASLTPIFGVYRVSIMPWLYSLSLLFLALTALESYVRDRREWFYCLLFLVLSISIYHPYTSAIVGITFFWYAIFKKNQSPSTHTHDPTIAVAFAFLVLVGTHLLLGTVDGYISAAVLNLLTTDGGGVTTAQQASTTSYSLLQLVTRFVIQVWGVLLTYFVFAGFTVLYLSFKWLRSDTGFYEKYISFQFIFAGLLSSGILVVGIFADNIIRVTQYLIIFSVLAVAIGIARSSEKLQSYTSPRIALTIVVLLTLPVIGLTYQLRTSRTTI
ncbi:hypothetical protein ACFQL4_25755 [Halosimplex aquaticum]